MTISMAFAFATALFLAVVAIILAFFFAVGCFALIIKLIDLIEWITGKFSRKEK